MSTRQPQTIKVYCLASFTDDEADEILTQLDDDSHHSYSAADVRVDLVPWTEDRDGGKDEIFRLFLQHQDTEEDFMFFIDRDSLDLQDFLVADIRNAKKAISLPENSLAQWSVIETTKETSALKPMMHSPDTQIVFGRCGRDTGWYGNSYAGIKKTYMNLSNGRVSFDNIVHKRSPRQNIRSEAPWISSVLDVCDEAYGAQARLAKLQASSICCEMQGHTVDESGNEAKQSSIHSCNGRNSFCLSSTRWALQA